MRTFFAITLGVFFLSSCAAGEEERRDDGVSGAADAVDALAEDDALVDAAPAEAAASRAAAAPSQLGATVAGLTVTVEPRLETCGGPGAATWRVRGRASAPLASISSWVPDDAFGAAQLIDDHAFTVEFREPSDRNTMASGLPLFLTLTPRSGAPVHAALWFRPRLQTGAGASAIRFYATVQPVWLAGDVEYRGRMAVAPPWPVSLTSVAAPRVVALEPGALRLAWTFDELDATLHRAPGAALHARAVRAEPAGGVAERSATLELRVRRLGLTLRDPREVWPTTCSPEVRACLAALPSGEQDTERCGSYRQVLACGGPRRDGGS
jgi:hypothetical protein